MKKLMARPGFKILARLVIMIVLFSAVSYYNGLPPAKAPPYSQVQQFRLDSLSGPRVESVNIHKPTVIVFWATWCGPCKIELARLQNLVSRGAIDRDSVLAIDVSEDKSVVQKAVTERGYTFDIALDMARSLASQYVVNATPTILFRNTDGTIAWRTAGVSPTLELRVLNFLRKS